MVVTAGDILLALKYNISVYEGAKGQSTYKPFTNDINGSLDYLKNADAPTTRPLNKFVGDATTSSSKMVFVRVGFGKIVGNYTGISVDLADGTFLQVSVVLNSTYGGGDVVPVNSFGWVREADVTNDKADLKTEVKKGNGVTINQLDTILAENDKVSSGTGNTPDTKTPDTNTPKAGTTILYVFGGLILATLLYFGLRKSN